jgi:DNA ligase (NAD+)
MQNTNLTLEEAEALLREASDAYYNGDPIMTDKEFDELWSAHKNNRSVYPEDKIWKHTVLDKLGARPSATSGFTKVKHLSPMMSLDNIFLTEGEQPLAELVKWVAKLDLGSVADHAILVGEPKIDGLSASVIYIDGVLERVVTRGDGEEGEDITVNAYTAGLIPMSLIPDTPWGNVHMRGVQEFRGEIYMPYSVFDDLCDAAITNDEEPPSNPRNAAAGMIRRKNPSSLRNCGLKFMVHGIENPVDDSYGNSRAHVASMGLQVPRCLAQRLTEGFDLAIFRTMLPSGEYPTDGIVFKLDSYKLRKALGATSRAPRWAIALKLEQEQVETTVSAITVQVGRSGILTPVAELVPVTVDGSVVSRATLHNESQVNRLGLMVDDTVVIQKAGGVIPEIVFVTGKHTKPRPRFSLLKHIGHQCPACGSHDILVDGELEDSMVYAELKRKNSSTIEVDGRLNLGEVRRQLREIADSLSEETVCKLRDDNMPEMGFFEFKKKWMQDIVVNMTGDGLRYSCGNTTGCKAQMAARVEHMASRGCLNIMGLGTEACDAIAQRGEIYHPFDILNKDLEWFASLSWVTDTGKNMSFGKARAKKVVDSFATIGKQPFSRWLAACGIHSVGENTSKEVSRIFKQPLDLVRQYMHMDTDGVHDVLKQIAAGADKNVGWLATYQVSHHLGPVSAAELLKFIGSSDGAVALAMMAGRDVVSDNWEPIPVEKAAGNLTGKTFAITGTMSQPRDYFKALIEEAGGKVTDTISAKLTALVCGEGGGGKRDKAAKLQIPVWDENQLRAAAL